MLVQTDRFVIPGLIARAIVAAVALALATGATISVAGALPATAARSVRVTFLVTAPKETPPRDTLTVVGNIPVLTNWHPPGIPMKPLPGRRYVASITVPESTHIQFKITRGDWGKVEKDTLGREIVDHAWEATRDDTVRTAVGSWADLNAREPLGRIRNMINTGRFAMAADTARALVVSESAAHGRESHVAVAALAMQVEALGNAAEAGSAESRQLADSVVALTARVFGQHHHYHLAALRAQASHLAAWGDLAAARAVCERRLELAEADPGPGGQLLGDPISRLADVLYSAGDYPEARAQYERALAIEERTAGGSAAGIPGTCFNLGICELEMHDLAAARRYLQRALVLTDEVFGPTSVYAGGSRLAMGALLADLGRPDSAEVMMRAGLAIVEKVLGPDHPEVGSDRVTLAKLLLQESQFDSARVELERARGTLTAALGPLHRDVGGCLAQLAVAYAGLGRVRDALTSALEAEAITREHERRTVASLPERQALRYADARSSGLALALTLAAVKPGTREDLARVWDAEIRSRALVLDEMAQRGVMLANAADTALARLAAERDAAWRRLSNLEVRGPADQSPDVYLTALAAARHEADEAERWLAERCASRRMLDEGSQVGFAEVARAVPPHGAVIAFVRYNDYDVVRGDPRAGSHSTARYVAFIQKAGAVGPVVVSLGAASAIDSLVMRWSAEAAQSPQVAETKVAESVYRRVAADLRACIWDPVLPAIAGAKAVLIVPDGSLQLLNFDTLPVGTNAYLVEGGPVIHLLSAERDLVTIPRSGAPGTGLLVMGDPAYDDPLALRSDAPSVGGATAGRAVASPLRGQRATCGTFGNLLWTRLPGTRPEAEETASLWREASASAAARGSAAPGSVDELVGTAASEAAFKRMAPGHRIVHLATHGFFVGDACTGTTTGPRADFDDAAPAGGENPLRLSGIVLAGANHRAEAGPNDEDGVLTAEEVATMNLAGVEWAVLSSCETGVGEVRAGEGVFGLRRAFQVAGARCTIMSLWSVEDETTREWMHRLYAARLERGMDAAMSVTTADRERLQDLRRRHHGTHPFFWGAFVAAGDWR